MKRGKPLKRSKPLQRKTRLRARSLTKKHATRPRDVPHMRSIKGLPCLLSGEPTAGPCSGPVEADHAGNRFTEGDGYRAYDDTCIPLCNGHHRDRTENKGFFATMSKEQRRDWRKRAIARATHELALKRTGARPHPEGS